MKKLFLTVLFSAFAITSVFAQFEQGKKYVNVSLSGLDLSYSKYKDLSLGINATAGYMLEDDWMVLAHLGYDYSSSNTNELKIGAKGRYYIEQNGLSLGLGLQYVHMLKSFNDIQLTPEVAYNFFLNRHITIEPAVYYDMSLTNFANKSKVGVRVGVGYYF